MGKTSDIALMCDTCNAVGTIDPPHVVLGCQGRFHRVELVDGGWRLLDVDPRLRWAFAQRMSSNSSDEA